MLIISFLAAVLPSLWLLWHFYSTDKYPEPARVVWTTFGLGVLSVIPIAIFAVPVGMVLGVIGNPMMMGFSQAFFAAAIPEETLKFLILTLYCCRHSAFDEPMDGLVYGVAASLGFATLENVLYVASGGLDVALMRAFTAVPGHAALGAIMGYYVGIGIAAGHDQRGPLTMMKAWAVPVILHGLYDFPLLSINAATEWSAELYSAMVLLALSVLLFKWMWAWRLARLLRRQQDFVSSN